LGIGETGCKGVGFEDAAHIRAQRGVVMSLLRLLGGKAHKAASSSRETVGNISETSIS
jgi:hypothetical protein